VLPARRKALISALRTRSATATATRVVSVGRVLCLHSDKVRRAVAVGHVDTGALRVAWRGLQIRQPFATSKEENDGTPSTNNSVGNYQHGNT
jgi:hypothetical protein